MLAHCLADVEKLTQALVHLEMVSNVILSVVFVSVVVFVIVAFVVAVVQLLQLGMLLFFATLGLLY